VAIKERTGLDVSDRFGLTKVWGCEHVLAMRSRGDSVVVDDNDMVLRM